MESAAIVHETKGLEAFGIEYQRGNRSACVGVGQAWEWRAGDALSVIGFPDAGSQKFRADKGKGRNSLALVARTRPGERREARPRTGRGRRQGLPWGAEKKRGHCRPH